MITLRTLVFAAIVGLVLVLNAGAQAQSDKGAESTTKPEGVTSATVLTLHGKIVDVNKAKKLVTLEGPEGRKVTLNVQNPYNLEAAKIGAPVVARFYEVVTIRKKKPGEEVPSVSLKEGIVTARPGGLRGAAASQQASVVVSVVAKDTSNGTVTVKGPDGSMETVKARDPKNLSRLNVGDELVVSVSRALAISLEKESGS
jgi:hypothetical protein